MGFYLEFSFKGAVHYWIVKGATLNNIEFADKWNERLGLAQE